MECFQLFFQKPGAFEDGTGGLFEMEMVDPQKKFAQTESRGVWSWKASFDKAVR